MRLYISLVYGRRRKRPFNDQVSFCETAFNITTLKNAACAKVGRFDLLLC